MRFKITYKHGLQNPIEVEANNYDEAKKLGLANHRKNAGFVDTVDKWPIDFVIDQVTSID